MHLQSVNHNYKSLVCNIQSHYSVEAAEIFLRMKLGRVLPHELGEISVSLEEEFVDGMLIGIVGVYRRFEGVCCLLLQDGKTCARLTHRPDERGSKLRLYGTLSQKTCHLEACSSSCVVIILKFPSWQKEYAYSPRWCWRMKKNKQGEWWKIIKDENRRGDRLKTLTSYF